MNDNTFRKIEKMQIRAETRYKTLKTRTSNEITKLKADRLEFARYAVDFVYEYSLETEIYLCRGCGEEHINIEEIDHSVNCRVLKAESIIKEAE